MLSAISESLRTACRQARIISCDLDVTLIETRDPLFELLLQSGHPIETIDRGQYSFGFTDEYMRELHDREIPNGLFLDMSPHQMGLQAVRTLASLGYGISYPTHRGCWYRGCDDLRLRKCRVDTFASLIKHGFPCWERVDFCPESKYPAVCVVGADLLFDDSYEVCMDVNGKLNCHGRVITAVLINAEYHKQKERGYPHRADCISDLLEYLPGPPSES